MLSGTALRRCAGRQHTPALLSSIRERVAGVVFGQEGMIGPAEQVSVRPIRRRALDPLAPRLHLIRPPTDPPC
jgi:hypothetical protein